MRAFRHGNCVNDLEVGEGRRFGVMDRDSLGEGLDPVARVEPTLGNPFAAWVVNHPDGRVQPTRELMSTNMSGNVTERGIPKRTVKAFLGANEWYV